MKRFFPFLRWFPYHLHTFRVDILAGLTVALVLIPQSMAYAQLAGLPAYFGLYAAFLPVAIAAMWGSSNQLGSGPVAVVSLLTASALTPLAQTGTETYIALAILLSLTVGLVQLSLGVFKLGVIVNFLSHPVIVGFTNAAALIIAMSQVSKLLGVKMASTGHFMLDFWGVLTQVGNTHLPTLGLGVLAIFTMWALKKWFPKIPGVLVAVALTTTISWATGFMGSVVGSIPKGLPELRLPQLNWSSISTLLSAALVISLVGFMEAISIAKAVAAKTRQRIDPNQELIGQGLANIVGSFSQSYPVSGSFSRTAVNQGAGAITGMSSVFTALIVLVALLFLTPLLYHLPQAALGAIIIMAVTGLINIHGIKHAWQASRDDGIAAIVTFFATLAFAPHLDTGIIIGTVLALGLYLYRTMRPRVAILGRHTDGTLRDTLVHDNLPTGKQMVAVRFDGSLYFANVSYFEDAVLGAVANQPDAKIVLIVGNGINQLDASGEEVIHHLLDRLKQTGISLVFSGLKKQVIDVMRNTGLLNAIGEDNLFATEELAILACYARLGNDSQNDSFLLQNYSQK
ncbi:MAG TPA: SulP family inorganic anion transporter [Burkholderiaceae bacterium]|nr:SulP family inorganic anion transporter [Burkholderiaceae bacterium]